MSDVAKHKRVNDILLGPLERPALQWLAAHMPDWVTPDTLTGIGIIGAVVTMAGYALTWYSPAFLWLASLGFVINWFGDSLDGTLARYRHIERPRYGFFVDHTVDALTVVLIFVGLGLSPYTNPVVALLGAIGYLMLSIMVYLKTYVTGVFEMTTAKIGPTEVRLFGIICNSIIFFIGVQRIPLPLLGEQGILTLPAAFLTLLMFSYFLVNTFIQARRFFLLDTKRLEIRQQRERIKAEKKAAKALAKAEKKAAKKMAKKAKKAADQANLPA